MKLGKMGVRKEAFHDYVIDNLRSSKGNYEAEEMTDQRSALLFHLSCSWRLTPVEQVILPPKTSAKSY